MSSSPELSQDSVESASLNIMDWIRNTIQKKYDELSEEDKQKIINWVFWAIDVYSNIERIAYKIYISLIMFVLSLYTWYCARSSIEIVSAYVECGEKSPTGVKYTPHLITPLISGYYIFDSRLTASSLYMWLNKLGYNNPSRVTLFIRKEFSILKFLISLDDETVNNIDLDSGDVKINSLISIHS